MSQDPHLRFAIDQKLDILMCLEFLSLEEGSVDFKKRILELHPPLIKAFRPSGNIDKNLVSTYVDSFYKLNKNHLKISLQKTSDHWQKFETDFFTATDTLFNRRPWPKGKYIGYLSIFDNNPRFIEDKTFQFFDNHPQGTNYVIAHEMFHFMFYDYIKTYCTNSSNRLTEDQTWVLSEVFNDLAFDTPILKSFKPKYIFHYPEVEDLYNKLSKTIPKEKFEIDIFLRETLNPR